MSFELANTDLSQLDNDSRTLTSRQRFMRWLSYQFLKLQIHRERRDLASLAPHLLHDIGVNRLDARRESRRTFSDIPVNRVQYKWQ